MLEERVIEQALADGAQAASLPGGLLERIKETADRQRSLARRRRRWVLIAVAVLLLVGAGVAGAQGGLLWEVLRRQTGVPPAPVPKTPPGQKRLVEQDGVEYPPAEASKVAGFRIRLPSLVPEGVHPDDVTVMVNRIIERDAPSVTVTYWKVEVHEGGHRRIGRLFLFQTPYSGTPWFFSPDRRPTNPQGERATCGEEPVEIRKGVTGRLVKCNFGGQGLVWVDEGIEHMIDIGFEGMTAEKAIETARSIR